MPIIRNVEFFWASVHVGDEKPNYDGDGKEWSVTVKFTDEQKKAAIEADPNLTTKIKKSKPNKDGEDVIDGWTLKINNPLKSKKGDDQSPIEVMDSARNPIDPSIKIGNGSKGHINYRSYPYKNQFGVRTNQIMITDLVEYNAGIAAEEGGYVAPQPSQKPVQQQDDGTAPWDEESL